MSDDAGAETTSNYRFQHVYAALLAIQMYNQKSDFVEITCEIGNDIIAKDDQGNLTAYQITRTDGFSISKDKIRKSMRHFLEQNNSQEYKAFCLIANQKIDTIVTKNNEMVFLSQAQVSKYSSDLSIDERDSQSRKCFEKMAFMVVNDTLALETLIMKEIVYSNGQISYIAVKCIEEDLINLVNECSRTTEKECSPFYTSVDKEQRQEFKTESRTITVNDVGNIINNCQEQIDKNEHNIVFRSEGIKENDEQVLTQFIIEASDKDEKIASTALISLEQIGREMKIYKSRRLKRFLRQSLNDASKSSYLDYYLDLIKRALYQSMNEGDNGFLNYVKRYLKKKIIESATSLDIRYDRCRTNAMQIIDDYGIMTPAERIGLYVQILMEFVKHCEEERRYFQHLQYLTSRLTNNTGNRIIIRRNLVALKKDSSSTENIKRRCDDLLSEYK